VKRKAARLQVEVEDFGRGMPHWVSGEVSARRPAAETGLGMIGMRERAEALGGHFEIKRGERGGVLIYVDMPIDARMPDDSLGLAHAAGVGSDDEAWREMADRSEADAGEERGETRKEARKKPE
jgi:hypothetical protein